MVNGILALVPSAKVGHIGLYRDHETHEPHEYYCKLPENMDERTVLVLDPMLATGGSAIAAIDFIKQKGCTSIKFMSIIAAPVITSYSIHYTKLYDSGFCNISLNIFVVKKDFLMDIVQQAACRSQYSFERDVIQAMIKELNIYSYSYNFV